MNNLTKSNKEAMLNIEELLTMKTEKSKTKKTKQESWDQIRTGRGKRRKIFEIIHWYIEKIFTEV